MPLTEYIDQYLQHLALQKRYSSHTVISYQNDLTDFKDFIEEHYPDVQITEIHLPMMKSWLASLKARNMEARTVNRKISALKSFYKFLMRMNFLKDNPAATLVTLRTKKALPAFVEEKQMAQLLDRSFFPEGFKGDTCFLIIVLFYTTGIRVSELVGLRETDFDYSGYSIKVLGKGNKERIIPVKGELLALVKEYFSEKRKNEETPTTYLFSGKNGKTLSPASVYKIVRSTLSEVTTLQKKSPHVLRHSFATHLSDHGAAINAIKELLGHSSLAATQIYTHTSISRLKEIYKQAHPKS